MDISAHQAIGSEFSILLNGDITPALLTSKSACTRSFLSVVNSPSTAAGELKSAGIAITFVCAAAASISFFVVSSWDCERADITTVSAPANANDIAIPFPIPLLPPTHRLVSGLVVGGRDQLR